ncbi:MAG: DnaJ domain-containing protein [Novosphingobium sp.]|nr:DnaJ domain-containing protein [Novosphingobium sp.]
MVKAMKHEWLHGRHEANGRLCAWRGCEEPGEFRAPGPIPSGFDGPGEYLWFCLDHVRAFNAAYDFFAGMSAEEILRAQSPISGWTSASRAFHPTAGIAAGPRWADFDDPLDAIAAQARAIKERTRRAMEPQQRKDGRPLSADERKALDVMGLDIDVDRKALKARYALLLRKYHPDHNGGDRGHEKRLRQGVEAYQLLRRASAFT